MESAMEVTPSTSKRASSSAHGPPAKKGVGAAGENYAGGGAGSKGVGDTDPQPIPRPFTRDGYRTKLTWAANIEITNQELKFLWAGMTLANIFPQSQTAIFDTLAPIFPLMKIGPTKVRLSNFIFLLDEIGSLGSTAVTTTSITPQMYFYRFMPKNASSIRIALTNDSSTGAAANMMGFTIAELGGGRNGPFATMATMNASEGSDYLGLAIDNQPIAAQGNFSISTGVTSGTLTSTTNLKLERIPNLMDRKQFCICNPGDVIDIVYPSELNRNWIPSKQQYFQIFGSDTSKQFYHYPTRNFPLNSSYVRQNSDVQMGRVNNTPRNYDFFTCPPIKKGDSTILKQRVSALLEISCDVDMLRRDEAYPDGTDANTLNYSYATWNPIGATTPTAKIVCFPQ
uniref:Uncharacterized protein n=1 Tax=Tarsiger cyanurus parvoviridae sp. TaxID=2794540 RepID=A0A8A4XDJ1_9VIRU|nr:MAG: hypothetical protein [Tarsiger cyanurus parvoviridae sp.]